MISVNQRAADLHWLAFLLTGDHETSIQIAEETFEADDGANPFFSKWLVGWSRRLSIARATAAIRENLAESARRVASINVETRALPGRAWVLDENTTKQTLERALLMIDVFPRAAVLLLIFERMALADAAVLLDASNSLVRKAQAIGVRELTANLAHMQGWRSSNAVRLELQHA
jgi:DNA-directed RNA polymerase specialized sigma24 family protein